MDKEIKQRIFEPYFTTKSKDEGSGLGLSIVYGIVTKSLNGYISVYSELGQGSTFRVYIPSSTGEVTVDKEKEKLPLIGGSERILLVDDEEIIIKMGGRMLSNLGYKVSTCHGSVAALDVFLDNPEAFDLVITDMTMPQMSGIELAQKILVVRELPIILSTGFSERINAKTAPKLGFANYIMKPFMKKDLAHLIRKTLDQYSLS